MALTVTQVERKQSLGNYYEQVFDITFDSSYPTGGEALTAATLGFSTVITAMAEPLPSGAVRSVVYNKSGAKLLAFDADGAEITDTTSLSTITARIAVRGK